MSAKKPPHFGVFVRRLPNGAEVRRAADTPEHAVTLAFDGWAEEKPATAKSVDDASLHPGSGSFADAVPVAVAEPAPDADADAKKARPTSK